MKACPVPNQKQFDEFHRARLTAVLLDEEAYVVTLPRWARKKRMTLREVMRILPASGWWCVGTALKSDIKPESDIPF